MKNNNLKKGGISILGVLFFGLIIILALSYFNVSLKGIVESPTAQENLGYVKDTSQSFWDKYLKDPVVYLWNDIWLEIFWRPFLSNMEKIRNSEPSDLQKSAPTVNYNESIPKPLFT